MRRFERIISLVAVVGVLLHAGLLVRHNGMMLDAAFSQLALSFAGGVICHNDGAQPGPGMPGQSGDMPNCQLCVGVAAGAAILPGAVALPAGAQNGAPETAAVDHQFTLDPGSIRPPSRAPPSKI